MLKFPVEFWIIIGSVIISCICLLITAVMFLKIRVRKDVPANQFTTRSLNQQKFENEIAFQVSCQQLDWLMMNMINEIEKRRHFLQEYMDKGKKLNSKSHSSKLTEVATKAQTQKNRDISVEDAAPSNFQTDMNSLASEHTHERISDLFQVGMNSNQIAKELKISQSEIDLYIKLHLTKNSTSEKHSSLFRLSV